MQSAMDRRLHRDPFIGKAYYWWHTGISAAGFSSPPSGFQSPHPQFSPADSSFLSVFFFYIGGTEV
jgi:hypothetical protein